MRLAAMAFAMLCTMSFVPALHAQAAASESAMSPSSQSVDADETASAPPVGDTMAQFERSNYRMDVQEAMLAARFLTGRWPKKSVEKLIAQKRRFSDDASEFLSVHARTLLNVGALRYELEVPALYAEWNEAMGFIDRAESARLYRPPDDLRQTLIFWRVKRDDQAAIDGAPWVSGPTRVGLDAHLAEVAVPAGVRYLDAASCTALHRKRAEIRRAARAAFNQEPVVDAPKDEVPGMACLRAADGSWRAGIAVVSRGHMELDNGFPGRADVLLGQVRSRSNPASQMNYKVDGAYAEAAVRWLIPPSIEAEQAIVRWALTDGKRKEPTGIDYAFLKFGASQQVLITGIDLHAADVVTELDDLPAGYAKERFTAEAVVDRLRQTLAPLERSLEFQPGYRYEDANAQTPRSPNTLDFLVSGEPSPLERAFDRIAAEQERKSNFFSYLWDHPRHLATIVLLCVVVLSALLRRKRMPS